MSKTIWQYSEQTLTGWTIRIIGIVCLALAYTFNNPLAFALGVFAFSFGTSRIFYARGMRDMHCIDQKIPAGKRLKDFEIRPTEEEK